MCMSITRLSVLYIRDQYVHMPFPLLACDIQVTIEECYIDVAGNEEWKRLYQYDIPVFHLNGKFLMKHKVDIGKLTAALALDL